MLRIYRWQKYLDGSNSYRPSRSFLDGSRICWEAIETNSRKFRWIEKAIRSIEKRSPRSSIDSYLSRSVEKLSSLIKTGFSKRGKTQIWMQLIKLFNQGSKQHFKLSKTSLKEKKTEHIRSKHTYTLNNSNQFYILKTN